MKNVKLSINNLGKIRLGYAVGFLLLVFAYLGTLYANRRFTDQAKLVQHSNQMIVNLETMLSKLSETESGLKGYFITGIPGYLRPYEAVKKTTDSFYRLLVNETDGNDFQRQKLAELKPQIDRRFFLFDNNLNIYERNNKVITDSLMMMQPQSKAAMDKIKAIVGEMKAKATLVLIERDKKVQATTNGLNLINIVSVIIAIGLVVFGFVTHAKENKAKQSAEQHMRDYQEELKLGIEKLAKANTELIKMRGLEKFAITGRIARTIAHEVRNPLTNINLAAEQLKTEIPANYESTDFLFEMIRRNSNRINQLISDLLNSTKFSELNFTKISANELLDETLKEATDRVSLTEVKVIKKYSNNMCDLSVDMDRIKIAVLNIIINGLEAMEKRPDSKLILETKGEEGKCKIIISDNGTGMDDEALSRLFEPYFTSKPKGNGLGLTNTQNIILNHKGDISVKSKKGEGTTFTITLNFAS
ncbi:MAG: CHASE3 domain-containing protein [Bacteroidota bacterium]|nr:CHASE3 domain-containing protein [Bacteroidota bacterium]